ncbi:uncharacterized protein LOC132606326 isoform X1 [Lycium barbarum]|uniref:uncharacterized protein LOC132606326 isoform X1 n=1 Tax=Lycium barbarum TaxID=112863 RepID=UPI00293EF2DC|nr:uncharacterized protein LOC132606326 isoform X1 [Lycium barbarum]XP_060175764.1 uncharacterized protein LOC132606326 isoform X1 [Lycium barbarum]
MLRNGAIIFMGLRTMSYQMKNLSFGERGVEITQKRLMKERTRAALMKSLDERSAQNGLWIFIQNSWKLCNNLVKEKCRNDTWRALENRKSIHHPSGEGSSSASKKRSSFRKIGTMLRLQIMPHLQINVTNLQQQQQQHSPETRRGPEYPYTPFNTNDIFARGESSTQQQVYHPQIQVDPYYLTIGSPYNNPFLSAQNNVSGGIQQHGPLFEMLGSQGLQDPVIGTTNYMLGLVFNGGDHHAQNDYNLNVDKAHVTTYSGSTECPVSRNSKSS